MFETPGLVTPEVLDAHFHDHVAAGVWNVSDPTNIHRESAVCKYDFQNMKLSEKTLYNCCTEGLKQRLQDRIKTLEPKKAVGPYVLWHIFGTCYNPSQTRIESLKSKLRSLTVRSYPGENITLFVTDATALVKEIKMNYLTPDQVPDLLLITITGLTYLFQ